MASIRTDDLPVDETLGETELRHVKGGVNSAKIPIGSTSNGPQAASAEDLENLATAVSESDVAAQRAVSANKMHAYNQRSAEANIKLTGILRSRQAMIKKIMGNIG